LTSTDGANWVQREEGPGETVPRSVAYGNSEFVEVNEVIGAFSMIRHSTDGLNWVDSEASGGGIVDSIAYGSGYFVAVGEGRPYILGGWEVYRPLFVLTSADGVTWAQRFQPGIQISSGSIAYGNGHFVAVGPGGTILLSG